MLLRSRLVAPVAVILLLPVLAACSGDDPGHLEALAQIDGVERVEPHVHPDDSETEHYTLFLEDGLSDDAVRSVADGMQDHFDEADGPGYHDSVELDFDGFRAWVYPRDLDPDSPDDDLDRALWLREDGRATASVYADHFRPAEPGFGHWPLVLAPAPEVARLALDYDDLIPDDTARSTFQVGSPDGSTRIQWTRSEGFDWTLDREVVQRFADLQDRYPGTTGWIGDGGSESRMAVYFSADALPLETLLERGDELLDGLPVEEVGWGLARAETLGALRRAITPAFRRLHDALLDVPGVVAVDRYGTIQVSDAASYAAVRELAPAESDIALVREPSAYIGQPPSTVFERQGWDPTFSDREYLSLARIDSLWSIEGVGGLVVDDTVTDAELVTVLRILRPLPRRYGSWPVSVGDPPIQSSTGLTSVGSLEPEGFIAAGDLSEASADLAERVEEAWERARR